MKERVDLRFRETANMVLDNSVWTVGRRYGRQALFVCTCPPRPMFPASPYPHGAAEFLPLNLTFAPITAI